MMAGTGTASDGFLGRTGRRQRTATASQAGEFLPLLSAPQAGRIVTEWRDLAARGREDNIFFHPGALLPAIEHLDQGVGIATARDPAGQLIALAPIERTRLGRIAPAQRIWVHDYGPLGAPLLDARAIDEATAALVSQLPQTTSLVVPYLPRAGAAGLAFRQAAADAGRPSVFVDQHVRAVYDRTEGSVGIRTTLPTRRRKEYARQMRRLAGLGAVTTEIAIEPDRVRARFEEFLALEAAGWKGDRGTALASRAATSAFARDMIFNRSERGTIRIVSLRLGDRPVAIVVCFTAGSTAFTWKIAYDEAFARFSPGAQLMLETADALLDDPAIERIDSCACANHPMIDHLWRGRMALGTLVIGPVGGGWLYRAGLAASHAETGARTTARTLRARVQAPSRKRSPDNAPH